jgi:two-component system sensor histidine kinase KdpD
LRYQRTLARASEARTLALCELSLDLSEAHGASQLTEVAERHLRKLFGPFVSIRLSGAVTPIEQLASSTQDWDIYPIATEGRAFGTIRVAHSTNLRDDQEQRLLLAACEDRIAVAVERIELSETARQAEVAAESERLRNALLSSVSHDLKTPLSSIMTAGTTLLRCRSDQQTERELLSTIVEESDRLNCLLTNLLSVTRLEGGSIRLNARFEALDDLVLGVLSRLSGRLHDRRIDLDVADELPLVSMDPSLIDQLIVNLVENALRYTPAGSPIMIRIRPEGTDVVLQVHDQGPGIPDVERERVFEKFYRGKSASAMDGGTGLGLTICRAVATAHHGSITLFTPLDGGTLVELRLPQGDPRPEAGARPWALGGARQ